MKNVFCRQFFPEAIALYDSTLYVYIYTCKARNNFYAVSRSIRSLRRRFIHGYLSSCTWFIAHLWREHTQRFKDVGPNIKMRNQVQLLVEYLDSFRVWYEATKFTYYCKKAYWKIECWKRRSHCCLVWFIWLLTWNEIVKGETHQEYLYNHLVDCVANESNYLWSREIYHEFLIPEWWT